MGSRGDAGVIVCPSNWQVQPMIDQDLDGMETFALVAGKTNAIGLLMDLLVGV